MSVPLENNAEEEGGFNEIAFTDVVFNLFAILLIFLLIVPFSLQRQDAEAPTLNREEMPLSKVRDCYINALRPASQFLFLDQNGLSILDYDALAMAYAQSDRSSARVGGLSADVTAFEKGRDMDSFSMSASMDFFADGREFIEPANPQAWAAASRGLVSFIWMWRLRKIGSLLQHGSCVSK